VAFKPTPSKTSFPEQRKMTKTPINEVIEEFAREIIERAREDGVNLPTQLDAFSKITAYFVGIVRVGAGPKEEAKGKTFGQLKNESTLAKKEPF
jgi:hypothetical protein